MASEPSLVWTPLTGPWTVQGKNIQFNGATLGSATALANRSLTDGTVDLNITFSDQAIQAQASVPVPVPLAQVALGR